MQSVPVTEKLENGIKDGFEEMPQPGRNGIKSKFPFGTLRPEKQLSHSGIRHFGCSPLKHFAVNLVGN